MTGAHNGRRRLVAERLQLIENPVEAVRLKRSETRNVLRQHPPRHEFPHQSQEIGPEPARVSGACASSSETRRLTRDATADEVDGREAVTGAHVSKPGSAGPVSPEDAVAEVINLHLPSAGHASALEPEI
jgi:hypothetical protein